MQNRLPDAVRQAIIAFGIDNGFIELTLEEQGSERIIANKLITSMLYASKRHGWEAPQCADMRNHIILLLPEINDQPQYVYEHYIKAQETQHRTYYGSYLSDDSDSDEEAAFQLKTDDEKNQLRAEGQLYQRRGQIHELSYQKKTGTAVAGELKTKIKNASELFDLTARTTIHHGAQIDLVKVSRDLDHLNILLKRKYTIDQAVAELSRAAQATGDQFSQFYVAEYRGITHVTIKWNKPSRMAHRRDPDEIGQRQYSASIYKAAGVSLFRHYNAAKQTRLANPLLFDLPAEELKEILLTFREPRPYSYGSYTYSSLAFLLQNIYTEDYDGFHRLISTNTTLKSILLNGDNPFMSMSDGGNHPNKYALGKKPYQGHEGDRLRPRWRADGKAERPYSGVVYTSLHPISDFTLDGPLHLISLNRSAEIKLKYELVIIAERESCFPAYLPENRVIHKHIAKYPSFKGPYKQIYTYKYGLTEALYNKFKAQFTATRPHTPENRAVKNLLGEWLCSFNETKAIDIARREAETRGGVLIYRSIDGTFSLKPPVDSVSRNTTEITEAIKTPVKAKQLQRAALSANRKTIQPLLTKNAVDTIIDDQGGYDADDDFESASISHDGNHTMSLAVSLMLNAIKNKRYRALNRFLATPVFQEAINEKFNSDGLEGATLLHLAAANNDLVAINLLAGSPHCHLHATADESCANPSGDQICYYEEITPAHLAIMRGCNEAAIMLLEHPRNNINDLCAYVNNKDLLTGDMLLLPTEDDTDEDYLGVAWYCRDALYITRTRGNSSLHLAVEFNNEVVLNRLLTENFIDQPNSDGTTAFDLAIRKKDANLVKLLRAAGAMQEGREGSGPWLA